MRFPRLPAAFIATMIAAISPSLRARADEILAMAALPPHVDEPRIFGSQREIHATGIGQFYKWTNMLARWSSEISNVRQCAGEARELADCLPAEWTELTSSLRGLAPRQMLDELNRVINRHTYVASVQNWGDPNHWETPFEFIRSSGQCQDYAIAKFMLLRALGFPNDALRVVVLRDERRLIDHAVLVVYLDGQALMLDSLSDEVVPADSVPYYRAYYSINETGWWLHLPSPLQFGPAQVGRVASR